MDWEPIDRSLRLAVRILSAIALGAIALPRTSAGEEAGAGQPKPPHIVFVTGDDEYGSELSMPMIARILTERHGMDTTVLYAENEKGERDRHANSIPGLEALKTADLAVVFMRFRALPQEQLDAILEFTRSAKPMIGLRTATHAFNYPGPPNDRWNEQFGRDTWGQKWIDHYGHGNSSLAKAVAERGEHPILRGVEPEFWLHSWLYIMNRGEDKLPSDVDVLMTGEAIRGAVPGGEKYGDVQPLSWMRELKRDGAATPKRIFYTSLGHPKDFENTSARRLLVNAIYWGLGREAQVPAEGSAVDLVEPYNPPDPH